MRVKSLLAIIVLNIFLMLFTSLLLEYLSLDERFNQLEKNIQVCTDMTIDISTASEEMFSEDYANHILSEAIRSNSHSTKVAAKTLVGMHTSGSSSDYKLYGVNSFMLAKYYWQNGQKLPTSYQEYMSKVNSWGSDQLRVAYEFLYGSAGIDYSSGSLSWANRNESKISQASSLKSTYNGNRNPTSNFKAFYDGIGSKVESVGYIKQKNGDSFKTIEYKYPTLAAMGLKLGSLNSVDSQYTADSFTSSAHIGKGYQGVRDSIYYLTPASLGVTYVPTEVFKPVFVANLDTMIRLQKASGGGVSGSRVKNVTDTMISATGCVDTDVYVYGEDSSGEIKYGILNTVNGATSHNNHSRESGDNKHIAHKNISSENIINDGTTEYDLSSVKVKVDYLLVDFNNTSTARLVSRLNGLLTAPTGEGISNEEYTRRAFLSNDTGEFAGLSGYESVRTKRLVARVSVKMKVHVLYQSSLLQWMCYRTNTSPHMDVKLYNPVSGGVNRDSNGVWYQYTTYYCQSR